MVKADRMLHPRPCADMLCTASGGAGGTCRTIPTSNGCVFVYPTFYCRVGVRTSPSAAGDLPVCAS